MKYFLICLILCGCVTGPRLTTQNTIDPILELERALAQTEMALSVAELQYMLYTWIFEKPDPVELVRMELRIEDLRETEGLMAEDLRRRTK